MKIPLQIHSVVLSLLLVQSLVSPAPAAEEATEPRADLPPALGTLGGRGGEGVAEAAGDVLIPVWGTDSGLVFINPRVSFNDNSEEEVNLGVGYRHLLSDAQVILGGNIYYDSRWTSHNNRFDQVGFGLEVLSRWVDGRANYYLPEEEKKVFDTLDTETLVSKTASTSFGTPYATGHQVKEKVTTTTTTTTMHESFDLYETTLEGFDVEMGVWLPLPESCPAEVGLFLGYYDFETTYGEGGVDGFKGRCEIRALPGLIVDMEVFEDDKLNGTDYFVGGRLQVPFEIGNLFSGKNPFKDAGQSFGATRRPFAMRLVENVIRDPQVRLTEDVEKVSEELVVEKDTSKKTKTIKDDLQFVNNENTSGTENGTAENPHNTVQEGVDSATGNSNVYVFAGSGPYFENVKVTRDGLEIYGQGKAIEGSTGKKFGGDAFPVIDGQVKGINGPAFRVTAHDALLQGLEIVHSPGGTTPPTLDAIFGTYEIGRVGVLAENADNLTLFCNLLHDNSYGALVLADASLAGGVTHYDVAIIDNVATDNSEDGIRMEAVGASGSFNSIVTGNNLSDNTGGGLSILADTFDSIDVSILDNEASRNSGGNGMLLVLNGQHGVEALLEDVTANDNTGGDGIGLSAVSTSGNVKVHFKDVDAHRNAGDGVDVSLFGWGNAELGQWEFHHGAPGAVDGSSIRANDNTGGDGIALTATAVTGAVAIALGEVEANRNAGAGLTESLTGQAFVLNSIDKITANDNTGGNGISMIGNSPSGQVINAINRFEVNRNAGGGLLINGTADGGAHNFLGSRFSFISLFDKPGVGIANDNQGGHGITILLNGEFSTSILGNVEANRNAGGGLVMDVNTRDGIQALLGIGIDYSSGDSISKNITANDNLGGNGISVTANSSFDMVEVFVVGGEAHRNVGDGLSVNATAMDDVGISVGGAIFDFTVQILGSFSANDNSSGNGISILADSSKGGAQFYITGVEASRNADGGIVADVAVKEHVTIIAGGAFLNASDTTADIIANDNMGGNGITLNVDSSDTITFAAGRLEANRNSSSGLVARITADKDIIGVVGFGVDANGDPVIETLQANNNSGGDGVNIQATSTTGSIFFAIPAFEANSNANAGVSMTLNGDADVHAYLGVGNLPFGGIVLPVEGASEASGNLGGDGVSLTAQSSGGSVTGAVAGIANGNAHGGLDITAEAFAGDLDFTIVDVTANNNQTDEGIVLDLSASGDLSLLIDPTEASGNLAPGVDVNATAGGSARALIKDLTVNNNQGGDGLELDLRAITGTVTARLENVTSKSNAVNGIELDLDASGDIELFGESNVVRNNAGDGVLVDANSTGGSLTLDFGLGGLGSAGQNSLTGNTGIGLSNAASGTVSAQANFWGNVPPILGTDFSIGVNAANHLTADPNP